MSPRIRFRYLIILFCHMGLALVACGDLSTSPSRDIVLASCSQSPNFVEATELKRWPTFPVEVYVDRSSLPVTSQETYLEGIQRGIGLWGEATGRRIGDFIIQFERPDAPIRISISQGPLPDNALGSTELTFTDSNIIAAQVRLRRSRFEGTGLLGADVTSTTAHEMGHALGIISHSPHSEDKMSSSGNFTGDNQTKDPLQLLTERDLNTLQEAYCR